METADDSTPVYTSGDSYVISSNRIYASCFPPWGKLCKCLLLWHHFISKIVIIRTFS